MIALLVASGVALVASILGTPLAIRYLRGRDVGQFIQEDLQGHFHKQGTPTMGGVVMVLAVVVAYLVAHVRVWSPYLGFSYDVERVRTSGLLALFALAGMALIGFLDDLIKTRRQRSLGLNKRAKFGGQLAVAVLFAWGAKEAGVSTQLSFLRPLGIDLGPFFVVLVLIMLTGAANGANLADGMDGLAAGSAALMFGAYTVISFWQYRNPLVYTALDPLQARDLAVVSSAMLGALLGFLWWNAPPARIFMGDVGSNAIGGLLAAMAVLTDTQLLLIVLGSIYVAETLSVMLQVASFRSTGRRIFRMAPIHFHFDLLGWPETTIVIRFWIMAGIGVALALGLFYADFIRAGGLFR